MEKFLYAKFEDNIIPSELEVYEFTRTDGAMVLSGQSKLRFIGSTVTPVETVNTAQTIAATIPVQPIVAPNPAPGKESAPEPISPPTRKKGYEGPTEEQLEARRILAKIAPDVLAKAADEVIGAAEAEPITQTTIAHHADGTNTVTHSTEPDDPEPAPKRKRRSKTTVEAPAEPVGEPTDFKLSEATAPEQTAIPEAAYYAVPEKPVIEGLPTAEEMKGFRARLFAFTNEILPKAGMVPTEGVGGINAKVKMFAATMFPGITDLKYLTTEQWNQFLGFLETSNTNSGAEALVAHIHDKIGVKE